jgi:hypothetical protein
VNIVIFTRTPSQILNINITKRFLETYCNCNQDTEIFYLFSNTISEGDLFLSIEFIFTIPFTVKYILQNGYSMFLGKYSTNTSIGWGGDIFIPSIKFG